MVDLQLTGIGFHPQFCPVLPRQLKLREGAGGVGVKVALGARMYGERGGRGREEDGDGVEEDV